MVGLITLLWESCYETGDPYLGTAEDVELLAEWDGEHGSLTRALAECGSGGPGLIEPSVANPEHWQVHDLWDHAPEYVQRRMRREIRRRQDGNAFHREHVAAGRMGGRSTASRRQMDGGGRSMVGQCPVTDRTVTATPAPAPAPNSDKTYPKTDKGPDTPKRRSNPGPRPKTPKPPKPEPKPTPEAILAFRDAAHRFPPKAGWSRICDVVGDRTDAWREHVAEWVLRGFNPTNIHGLLEAFGRPLPIAGARTKGQKAIAQYLALTERGGSDGHTSGDPGSGELPGGGIPQLGADTGDR